MIEDLGLLDLSPEKILAFEPSEASQGRVEDLMAKLHDETISDSDRAELNYYLELDHLMRFMKARAAEVLATSAV